MSFSLVGLVYTQRMISNNVEVLPDKNVSNKPKILDNTRIHGLKSRKSNNIALFLGIMFVSSVIGYVTYVKMTSDEEISLSSIENDAKHNKISSTNINSKIYSDTAIGYTVMDSLLPLSYILYIAPNILSSTYNAMVKIRVKCTCETSKISLYSSHHYVTKFVIMTGNITDITNIPVIRYSKKYDILVLSLNAKLVAGYEYNLHIGFHGELTAESKGMFVRKYQDGDGVERQMISGMFQFGSARNVFPCFDEPAYKASFQVILQHNKSFSAISNMPVEKTVIITDGLVETYFKKSPPMSPGHFSFVIAEYTYKEIVTTKGLKIRLYAPKGRVSETLAASKMIPSFIQYYQKMYGVKYTLPKLDFVPMNMLSLHTSVSPGLIILPEELFLLNEGAKTLTQVELSAQALGQALVKQLLGCLVTLDLWSDVWFTESMTRYLGYQAVKYHYPSWDLKTQFYLDITNKALMKDASNFTESVIQHISKSQGLHHYDMKRHALKGAAFLNMISQYVGKSTFHESITLFCDDGLKQHKGDKSNNFLGILNKTIPQDDIVDMTNSWFTHPGFPLVTMYTDVSSTQYVFKQKQFIDQKSANNTPSLFNWWIPVFVRSLCDTTTTTTFLVNKGTERFELSNCSLHKVNSGGSGFYRFNYNKIDIRNFIELLNTNHTALTAVDRANLIADIFEVVRFNPQNISTALDFTNYLSKEHHFVPYKIALTQLREIANLFVGTQNERCVKEYIQKKTQPVLIYLNSLSKHDHMQKKLIGLLMREAVTYDDNIAISLDNMCLRWMISNSTIQLPYHLRELIFEIGILHGSIYEWSYMFTYFKNTPSNAEKDIVLSGLSVTKNKLFLKQLVDYANKCTLSSTACIKEKLKIWTKVCQNINGGRKLVTNAFFNNWKYVLAKAEEIFEDLETFMLGCLGSGRTMADIIQVKTIDVESLSSPSRTLLQKVIERTKQRINFSENEEDIGTWFKDNCGYL